MVFFATPNPLPLQSAFGSPTVYEVFEILAVRHSMAHVPRRLHNGVDVLLLKIDNCEDVNT